MSIARLLLALSLSCSVLPAFAEEYYQVNCRGGWTSFGVREYVARIDDAKTLSRAKFWEYSRGTVNARAALEAKLAGTPVANGSTLVKSMDPNHPDYGVEGKPISGPVYLFDFDDDGQDWDELQLILPANFADGAKKENLYKPFAATFVESGTDQPTVFRDVSCYVSQELKKKKNK